MPKGVRYASVIGGILGDIVRFESGLTAAALRLLAMLEKRACRNAEIVFAPSEYTREKIVSLYGVDVGKVNVLHNGIFFDEWAGMVQNSEVESRRPLTVLCVARLYRRKGIDKLISAWPEVVSKNPKALLRIVGEGLESENLKQIAGKTACPESVIFEGDVRNREEMARFYANSDLFCLPSLHETFGLVYLEAMAAGKPVIALNTTAVPEVVRDGIDGILIEPDDTDALAGAIVRLLGDAETRKRMGSEGRARVRENFDWYTVIKPLKEWIGV
jgi:glycosyltransferase involved in cell wall biosynthesis